MPTDIIHANLKKGYYRLKVVRRKGNRYEPVISFDGLVNLTSLSLSMVKYHQDCVLNHNTGGKGFPEGGGSDRISTYHPDMNPWRLQVNFEVALEDKSLLEGIVNMHNQHQDILTNGQSLPLS